MMVLSPTDGTDEPAKDEDAKSYHRHERHTDFPNRLASVDDHATQFRRVEIVVLSFLTRAVSFSALARNCLWRQYLRNHCCALTTVKKTGLRRALKGAGTLVTADDGLQS